MRHGKVIHIIPNTYPILPKYSVISMASESKEIGAKSSKSITEEVDTEANGDVALDAVTTSKEDSQGRTAGSKASSNDEEEVSEESLGDVKTKKKKSKKSRVKKLLTGGGNSTEGGGSTPASKLTPEMVDQLLEMNPSLKGEVAGMDKGKAVDTLKKLNVADLLTGMAISGKNQKDMASYKFWQTQPVPRFGKPCAPCRCD